MRSERLGRDSDESDSHSLDSASSDAMASEDDGVFDDDVLGRGDDRGGTDHDARDTLDNGNTNNGNTDNGNTNNGNTDNGNTNSSGVVSDAQQKRAARHRRGTSSSGRKSEQDTTASASSVLTLAMPAGSNMLQTTGQRRQQPANMEPTRRATKTNAVRKRVARDDDDGGGDDDPYDSTVFESATETMANEMQAMKQVFLPMLAKKMQQKEERVEQCKRLYKDAFKADVDRAFKRASRARVTAMDEASGKLQRLGSELETSATQLRDTHATYKNSFATELERASADVATLKRILQEVDAQYACAAQRVDAEFQEIEDAVEQSLLVLRDELDIAAADKTFASAFKLQLERLL